MINEMRNGYLRAGLTELAAALPENTDVLEVGCYSGESTEIFLKSGRVRRIVSVDPFRDDLLDWLVSRHNHKMFDVLLDFRARILDKYPQASLIKTTSIEAAPLLYGQKFGLVYLDGDHTYETVHNEIAHLRYLVQEGGYMGGHDYNDACPGVIQAVKEAFGDPDKVYQDCSWIKKL